MLTGAEHLAIELALGLDTFGHDVTILSRGFEENCIQKMKGRVNMITPSIGKLITGMHFIDSILDLLFSPFFLLYLPKKQDTFVFWNDNTIASMWLYKTVFRGKTRALYYCLQPAHWAYDRVWETVIHNLPLSILIPAFLFPYRFLDRLFVTSADNMIVLSSYMKDVCAKIYNRNDISIVYAGINIPVTLKKQVVKSVNDEITLLSVGKLIPKKNFHIFLKVIKRLLDAGIKVKGIILGDGPKKHELLTMAQDLNVLGNVEFTGYLESDDDVFNYYNNCDVYMYLEENVPFGLTILEAGIRFKPVIAAQGGGVNETMINGDTGFIVENVEDVDEICSYVIRFAEDPELRGKMGEKAHKHVIQFDYSLIVETFIQHLVGNEK